MVSNFLPPDSQPWVRALENKVKTLETSITSLKKATTSRVSSAVTTPGGVLTLGGEKVPGEGMLHGSLEHLDGVYALRYGHEFHGLTQYVLIVSGKASGAGGLSLLGPEGQVLDSDTLEIDTEVEDATEFHFAVEFPIHTMNYEFEPEDEDGGGPDTDQEVVASYVLPDTGTLSLVTGATLSELSYEIRSANSSQVTIDTSSGVPTITGLSADGTTIDAMHDYSGTLEFLEDALEEARTALEDARTEAEQNFGTLDDKLGQAFPDDIFDVNLAIEQAKVLADGAAKEAEATALAYADEKKQEAIDAGAHDLANLQIGGRNLMRDSRNQNLALSDQPAATIRTPGRIEVVQSTGWNAYADWLPLLPADATVSPGDVFTLSVEVKAYTTTRFAFRMDIRRPLVSSKYTHFGDTNGEWVKVATTITIPEDNTLERGLISFRQYSGVGEGEAGAWIEYRNWKLERGTKATDWTPAPEDVDAGIAGAKQDAIDEASTDAQTKADEAKQAAIDAAKADLDALEVGGRNLVLNSKAGWESTSYAVTGAQKMSEPWVVGETYTVTVKGEVNAGQQFRIWRDSGFTEFGGLSHIGNGIHRVTAKAEETDRDAKDEFRVYNFPSTGAEFASIEWVKIERGTKATDWTPAPEDVNLAIQVAMSMANGKNSASYTDVADGVAEPGPAPTQAMGLGRRQFDVHRNRRSNGQIIGEWVWTGTAWSQLTLSDAMLSSLDVGKLTAGTAGIETAVVNKLWGQLGVFDKLDVRTDAYVSGINLKDGAVTARTLNVVPEQGSGGLQLKPEGMMVIDAEGNGTVDLRVNADNYLSFYRDDATSFSVSADGELTAQDVSANANLLYRGTELSELLEPFPRGLIYTTLREPGPHKISFAAYTSRLAYIQAQKPETDRMWRIWATYQAMGNATNQDSWNLWTFAFNGGLHYNQNTWQTIRQGRQRVPGISDYDQHQLVAEVRAHSLPWSDDGNGVFSINMANIAGSSFNVRNIFFWIDDVGSPAAATASPSSPWIRPEVTSDAAPTPTEQQQTRTWNMSGFQNYRAGVRLNHASGNIAGGNYSGEWRGVMFFPHASIRSALSGATIDKVEIYLQNAHTYAYSGSTILIGTHNYASAPSSSPSVAARTSQHFGRGQGRWVTLPTAVGTGFANGTIKGLAVYGSSTANYATWTPSAPKLRITYKK